MLARTVIVVVCVALAACSSKQPRHRWSMENDAGDAPPSHALKAAPLIVVADQPVRMVNFVAYTDLEYEKRKSEAQHRAVDDTASAWAQGTMQGAAESVRCLLFAPICAGVILIGGIVTLPVAVATSGVVAGIRQGTFAVTEEQAARLSEAAAAAALNERFGAWAQKKLGDVPRQGEYPRLAMRVDAVLMMPMDNGVSFRVAVAVQAYPAPGEEWPPSQHYVQLPIRTAEEWLGSSGDGAKLKHDLNSALKVMAYRVMPLYLPEPPPKPKVQQPWEKRFVPGATPG